MTRRRARTTNESYRSTKSQDVTSPLRHAPRIPVTAVLSHPPIGSFDAHLSLDKHSFSPTDPTDKVTPSTLPSNPLSVELQRQTSTPLSFHSLPSSSTDDQSSVSPASSTFRTSISADVVNELTKGANALDKLSCSPTAFVESIEAFARSTVPKQAETVAGLEQKLDK